MKAAALRRWRGVLGVAAAAAAILAGGCAPSLERPAAAGAEAGRVGHAAAAAHALDAADAANDVPAAPPAITSGTGLAPTTALAPLLPLDELPAADEGAALSRVAPVVWEGVALPAPADDAGVGVEIGRGAASWYGGQFHNRLTASGERFDSAGLTAAHRTLPFGTRLCVRSLVNGRAVVVRVTDRGPYAAGRIIDLSRGAAESLGMLGLGIKQVVLSRASRSGECVDVPPEPAATTRAERRPAAGTRLASSAAARKPSPPAKKHHR